MNHIRMTNFFGFFFFFFEEGNSKGCKYVVPGWSKVNGWEFYLSKSTQDTLSWYEAEAKAIELGGRLSEITSDLKISTIDELADCKSS